MGHSKSAIYKRNRISHKTDPCSGVQIQPRVNTINLNKLVALCWCSVPLWSRSVCRHRQTYTVLAVTRGRQSVIGTRRTEESSLWHSSIWTDLTGKRVANLDTLRIVHQERVNPVKDYWWNSQNSQILPYCWMVNVIKCFCVVFAHNSWLHAAPSIALCHICMNNSWWPQTVFLSNLSQIASSIPLPTNESTTLLIVGVISCSTYLGGFIFGITTTFAFFQMIGTTPSAIDKLKIQDSGSQKANAKSRNSQLGRLSGLTLCNYRCVPIC